MSNDMEKIAQVLAQIPALLRNLSAEVEASRVKNTELEKRAQAENLVAEMEDRGLVDTGTSRQERVDALLNSDKDLGVVKEAMQFQLGDLSAADVADDIAQGDELTNFLVQG